MQNFNNLKNQKSEQNVKMEQMTKEKRVLEAEISQLRQDKKDIQKEKIEAEKKQQMTYERLEEAMKKIGLLEKDLEL